MRPGMHWFAKHVIRLSGISFVALVSCSRPLEEAAYRAYLQDSAHGLTQQIAVEAATATCSYRPTAVLVAQDVRTHSLPSTPPTLDSLRRTYEGRAHFTLALSQGGAEIENQFVNDRLAYAQAIAYLNTGLAQDVYLAVPGQDSVAALAAAYPRQYGNTGRSTVLLVFDTRHLRLDRDFHLVFRDRQFGLGVLRFPFRAADLAALPDLKF